MGDLRYGAYKHNSEDKLQLKLASNCLYAADLFHYKSKQ